MKTPFLGGFNVSRSPNLADAQLMNLYPELVETKDGKAPGAFFATPGLMLFNTLGNGPIRAMYPTPPFLYVVSGNQVFALNNAAVAEPLGTIGTYTGACSIFGSNDNGQGISASNQFCIVDGTGAWITQGTSQVSPVSLPFTPAAVTGAYQDEFGLLVQALSNVIWQSNVGDLTTWPALNFQAATGSSDRVVGIASLERQIWVFKERHLEIWADQGLSPFAFQAIPGAFLQFGCIAPASIQVVGETIIWLSQNDGGYGEVRMTSGYGSSRISTHAIETIFQTYPTVSDATAYYYQQQGHTFYVLTFPSASATWAYDLTTQLWAQRGSFSNGQFTRDWTSCAVNWNGNVLFGDFRSGNIYQPVPGLMTDNGAQRKWVRSWRALPQPTMEPTRFSQLTIDMQTGSGVQPGANPQVMLRWSDDGGHVWSDYRIAPAGKTGENSRRVMFNRLGATRRNSGLDRIFELSSSDVFDVSLMGAEIE